MNEAAAQYMDAPRPIGAIIRELDSRLRTEQSRISAHGAADLNVRIAQIYSDFDLRFENRIDYKIWRLSALPLPSRELRHFAGWRTDCSDRWEDWHRLAEAAVEASDGTILWS